MMVNSLQGDRWWIDVFKNDLKNISQKPSNHFRVSSLGIINPGATESIAYDQTAKTSKLVNVLAEMFDVACNY